MSRNLEERVCVGAACAVGPELDEAPTLNARLSSILQKHRDPNAAAMVHSGKRKLATHTLPATPGWVFFFMKLT